MEVEGRMRAPRRMCDVLAVCSSPCSSHIDVQGCQALENDVVGSLEDVLAAEEFQTLRAR